MLLKKKLQKLKEEDFKLVYCKTYFFFLFDVFCPLDYSSVKKRRPTGRHIGFAENFRKPTESDIRS